MAEEHLLEYRYSPGETLRYRQMTYYVMDDPEIGQVVGQTEYLLVQKVTSAQGDYYDLECQQSLVSKAGILGETIPGHLVEQRFSLRMDKRGGLHGDRRAVPSAPPAFPDIPIPVGLPWTVTDAGETSPLIPRLQVTFQIERFETLEGRRQAHIVSESATAQRDSEGQPYRTQIQGHVQFDLERGRQVRSHSVVHTVWETGKSMQTAIELELEP